MECPVCKTFTLATSEIDEKLFGYRCKKCNGIWIKGFHYWKWLKDHKNDNPEKSFEFEKDLPVADSMIQ